MGSHHLVAISAPGYVRRRPLRVVSEIWHGVHEHDLLTYGSAIAFQVLTGLIPLLMFALALLGFLHLQDAWHHDLAPQVRHNVSPELYALVNKIVLAAMGSKKVFWLTGGVLITLWELSGAVRAIMDALTRIYGGPDERSKVRRYVVSFTLALASGVGVLLAFAVARFGPSVVHDGVASVLRWPVAFAVLLTVVWLLVRFAPAKPPGHGWISFGSLACVTAWLGTSLAFGLYVNYVADYGSIFSSLAALFLLLTYLYLSACAFLAGALLDAILLKHSD
jgi:membrane protein